MSQQEQIQAIQQTMNTSSAGTVQMVMPELNTQVQMVQNENISHSSSSQPTLMHSTATVAQTPLQHVQVIQQPLSSPYFQPVYSPQQPVIFPGNLTLHTGAAPVVQSIAQNPNVQLQAKPQLLEKVSVNGQTYQIVNAVTKAFPNQTLLSKPLYSSSVSLSSPTQVTNANQLKQMTSQPQMITTQSSGAIYQPQVFGPFTQLPQNITWATPGNYQSPTFLPANSIIIRNQHPDMFIHPSPQTAMLMPVASGTAAAPGAYTYAIVPQKQQQISQKQQQLPQKPQQIPQKQQALPQLQQQKISKVKNISYSIAVGTQTNTAEKMKIPIPRTRVRPKGKIAVPLQLNPGMPMSHILPQHITAETQVQAQPGFHLEPETVSTNSSVTQNQLIGTCMTQPVQHLSDKPESLMVSGNNVQNANTAVGKPVAVVIASTVNTTPLNSVATSSAYFTPVLAPTVPPIEPLISIPFCPPVSCSLLPEVNASNSGVTNSVPIPETPGGINKGVHVPISEAHNNISSSEARTDVSMPETYASVNDNATNASVLATPVSIASNASVLAIPASIASNASVLAIPASIASNASVLAMPASIVTNASVFTTTASIAPNASVFTTASNATNASVFTTTASIATNASVLATPVSISEQRASMSMPEMHIATNEQRTGIAIAEPIVCSNLRIDVSANEASVSTSNQKTDILVSERSVSTTSSCRTDVPVPEACVSTSEQKTDSCEVVKFISDIVIKTEPIESSPISVENKIDSRPTIQSEFVKHQVDSRTSTDKEFIIHYTNATSDIQTHPTEHSEIATSSFNNESVKHQDVPQISLSVESEVNMKIATVDEYVEHQTIAFRSENAVQKVDSIVNIESESFDCVPPSQEMDKTVYKDCNLKETERESVEHHTASEELVNDKIMPLCPKTSSNFVSNQKQRLKAVVRPHILTHVIDGFVIYESSEPFPVNRSSLMAEAFAPVVPKIADDLKKHDDAKHLHTKNPDEPTKPDDLKEPDEPEKTDYPKKRSDRRKHSEPKKHYDLKKSEPKKLDEPKISDDPKKLDKPKTSKDPKKPDEPKISNDSKKPGLPKKSFDPKVPGEPANKSSSTNELEKPNEDAVPTSETIPRTPGRRGRKRKELRSRRGRKKLNPGGELNTSTNFEVIVLDTEAISDSAAIENVPVIDPRTLPIETTAGEKKKESIPPVSEVLHIEKHITEQSCTAEVIKKENSFSQKLPTEWTVEDVCDFVRNIPNCQDYAEEFRSQEIDGKALLLLKVDHIVTFTSMKFGPALKLISLIDDMKEKYSLEV